MNNILDRDSIRSCTSCQVCGAVCPTQSISFNLDGEGFIRPIIDGKKCIECGLCKSICPRFDDNISVTSKEELSHYQLYAAFSKNEEVLKYTTSGGIADVLSHQLMGDGYKVIGVLYDEKTNRACHSIANDDNGLLRFRGSKYIQPYSFDAFRTLINNCNKQKFAVFGLPCQIYALSRYLEFINKREQCILIDLYCHGCPSSYVWEKVSQDIRKKIGKNTFDDVIWRSKTRGWGEFVLEVQNGGRRVYLSTPLDNAFYDLYFSNQVLNDGCNNCLIRGTLAYTDIRLGDFWGPAYRKNLKGVSGVSIVTKRGALSFSRIRDKIEAIAMPYDSFLPFQSWDHNYIVDRMVRHRLLSILKEEASSPQDAVSILPSHKLFRNRVKSIIKYLLSFVPGHFSVLFRRY